MSATSVFDLGGPLPSGTVAIEASAGTGKTHALASLATRFVAEAGVPVSELLVVTFTRAAAAELRDRIRSRLAQGAAVLAGRAECDAADAALAALASGDADVRRRRLEHALIDFDTATITTIHGFAQQMLAALGASSPGDVDAALVDDTRELVAQACADVLARTAVEDPAGAALLPDAGKLAWLAETVLGNPGIAVVPGTDPAESGERAARARRAVDEVVDLVHRRRRLAGTLSFDDVLTQLDEALRSSASVRAALRRRFSVALVDEFQDTDPVQWRIFSRLAADRTDGATLVLVGDPKQAIYAFRGADVHTYLDATSSAATSRATLATNWRSSGALVSALDRLLAGATFGDTRISFPPVHAAPAHERLAITTRSGVARPALHLRLALGPDLERTSRGFVETASAEAAIGRDLARYVQDLLEDATIPERGDPSARRPARPSDVAVLVGTHDEARVVQAALRRQGVPAVVSRGASVLESRAATEWRQLLAAIGSPGDQALTRTAALSWWFGWTAAQVAAAGDDELADVHDQLAAWSRALAAHGPVELCAQVLADSGAVARVLATPDGDRDVTDLEHVASLVQASTTARHRTAAGLLVALEALAAARPTGPEDDVTSRRIESEAEAVQVMTVYASKGLEFPVVCVPTLWRASRAKARGVVFHDPATGRRTVDVAPSETWPDRAAHDARTELAGAEVRGANLRLLYVALTRARFETVVWWTRAPESDITGLARVLFARGPAGVDATRAAPRRVDLPEDRAAGELLTSSLVHGPEIAVTEVGSGRAHREPWRPTEAPGSPPQLAVAELGRDLDGSRRRWSFSAVVERDLAAWSDPADDSLGDARAGDEGAVGERGQDASLGGSDLPLGAVPGGARFGTLVHEVLERVDFAADDLDRELATAVEDRLGRTTWPVGRDELVAGLRAAIETPLGQPLGGHRLRDFARGDRLDELGFELHLGRRGAHRSDREVGALVADHLAVDDPVRPWAVRLASGIFDVVLAGHLTGSIDVVLRVRDTGEPAAARYVLADYKTNTLGPRSRLPRAEDYEQPALHAAMAEHHYPLQALFYSVALHRYLRWRVRGYDPATHLGGAAYLFVRGMSGPAAVSPDGTVRGVLPWAVPPALTCALSDLLGGTSTDPEESA